MDPFLRYVLKGGHVIPGYARLARNTEIRLESTEYRNQADAGLKAATFLAGQIKYPCPNRGAVKVEQRGVISLDWWDRKTHYTLCAWCTQLLPYKTVHSTFKKGDRSASCGLQLLGRNVERFRGGLVFEALGFLYHSTLGSRVVTK